MEDVAIDEQGRLAAEFVSGVVQRFAINAEVNTRAIDDETVEVVVTGSDLGLLVGPRGAVITSLQDLARTVVQRRTGSRSGRILLDVAGYRERRRAALERFTRQVAEEVLTSGAPKALEPMPPPDRKVVHDTVNSIDGVETTSEGEDSRRHVVIFPS